MAKFKISFEGNKSLLKSMQKYGEKTRANVADEIEATVYDIQAKAVQAVPVDTGILKNSISAEAIPNSLEGQVEARVHYAPYIEFGTGGKVDVPAGLEDYAMRFKGANEAKVAIPPQPFLFPAFFEEGKKMVERINKELGEWN